VATLALFAFNAAGCAVSNKPGIQQDFMPKEHSMLNRKMMIAGTVMTALASACAFASGRSGRGAGEMTTVTHTPPAFEVLYIYANADVKVHRAEEPRLVITAPSGMHGRIELRTKKNELEIRIKGNEKKSPRFSIDVHCPPLSGIGAAYATSLDFAGEAALPAFMVGLAGMATINGTLECARVQINMAGSGTIRLTGSAEAAEINLVGDGTFDAKEFKTGNVSAHIVGDGKIIAWITGTLTTNIVGNAEVSYRGDPVMEFTGMGNGRFVRIPENS
jgi:hypothetical protein